MTRFYKGIRVDPFEHMPFTVLVTINGSEPAKWPGWSTFVSAFRFCAGIGGCRNLWLLKPTRCVPASVCACAARRAGQERPAQHSAARRHARLGWGLGCGFLVGHPSPPVSRVCCPDSPSTHSAPPPHTLPTPPHPRSLNRGIGIEVLKDLPAIQTFLLSKASKAALGRRTTWVVQKYIENPVGAGRGCGGGHVMLCECVLCAYVWVAFMCAVRRVVGQVARLFAPVDRGDGGGGRVVRG
jgi:hypothetical protein